MTPSAPPNPSPAASTSPRHLLDFHDWSAEAILELLEMSDAMAQVLQRTIKKVPALQGFTMASLFFENSTRTRLSFERAARAQSADVMTFASGGSSLSKGESLRDTLYTLDAMQADVYVVRHAAAGVPYQLSRWTDAAIINAGDGWRAHPSQALLDAYTFSRNFANFDGFAGKKLVIVGDALHSRVARSNVELWSKLGAEVCVCGPATLLPEALFGEHYANMPGVSRSFRLEAAVEGAHAVMALRLQLERMRGGLLPSLSEYRQRYQLREDLLKYAHPDALVMHPGPMNRDVEISGALADSPRSLITRQVANGVPVRMAVLYKLLVGRA